MGRNPPKNLSNSLKDYLKKSDPVKLARVKERVRQERAIEKALERYESMPVPTAEDEVKEIVQDLIETTGELPTEEEVQEIKVGVIQDRRRRGVQAGAKRGPYQTKFKTAQSLADRERKLKGIQALERFVRGRKLRRLQQEQQAQSPLLQEMIAQQFPQSQISLALPSPTDSGAVFDSRTGQLVELRHPSTGELVDPSSSYGKFLLKSQRSSE